MHQYADMGSVRLRALVAKREWNEIEDIARAKKSPIGWEVSVLLRVLSSCTVRNKLSNSHTNHSRFIT